MTPSNLPLIGAFGALALLTGVAAVAAPGPEAAEAPAARLPVQRSALVCPAPTASDLAETQYTAFTPGGGKAKPGGGGASAGLLPATTATGLGGRKDGKAGADGRAGRGKDDKPVVPLESPGSPVVATTSDSSAPALTGTADGALAPGWTVQQTSVVAAGRGRGVLGTACTAPDTDFWFPSASTAKERQDFVHLTNPDPTAAVVDLELYGRGGKLKTTVSDGITVPPRSTVKVLLSTLTQKPTTNVALHAVARAGRVGAAVEALDDRIGGDWLSPAADPSGSVVLPGIPKDATSVRLVALATGEDDADLKVRLAGPSGRLTPAGHETLHVKSGMTSAIDLGDLTKGEPGSLVLTPADGGSGAPVVAALRVTRGKGSDQETAFVPAVEPLRDRGTVADNRAKRSTLALVAPGRTAKVKVTVSAGSEGGSPVSRTYTVKGGTTKAVEPPFPSSGKGSYALTVEPVSGGPVHASRMLAIPQGGIPMFTVQTIPDDRGTVNVPHAEQDLSLLND
ncbi:DUF5719 family protein [Streptomyces meridianus]|uniref:DUF5719 family protein n=1 Tax=Streptomyces meridianus TaxID=2938945 RepID=A0ABT0XBB2_9ACTN|nr:DUF5719 family protein [Streptomyces meridianus]MCM2579228.1 DUF5719 family protein [Streptomyces meridianus]